MTTVSLSCSCSGRLKLSSLSSAFPLLSLIDLILGARTMADNTSNHSAVHSSPAASLVPARPSSFSSSALNQDYNHSTGAEGDSNTSVSMTTPLIIGIVVAVALSTLLFALLVVLVYRRNRQRQSQRWTNMSWLNLGPNESQSFPRCFLP